jgi:glycine/D-amino acid oxidase-like deaminating enzyme
METKSRLIVGGGMAGLTAACYLSRNGWAVTLLDKGRCGRGRMAQPLDCRPSTQVETTQLVGQG